ncbi:50S ribosomal protein L3 N(5)-glutamine methyltransferase [Eionea flava]
MTISSDRPVSAFPEALVNTPPSTIAECIDAGAIFFEQAQLFFGHGTDNAQDEALWLAFSALGLSFDVSAEVLNQPVSQAEWLRIESMYLRRVNERIPAAYIVGEAWFCGYVFTVNEHVLVPRSPIAELILSRYQPWLPVVDALPPQSSLQVLDMCTGSGCIGIATALVFPDARVDLCDISTDALMVAEENIKRHQVSERVAVLESDVFDAIPEKPYDLIVANPPYVDKADIDSMPAEYQSEPAIALGSGDDGLDVTRRLLRQAATYLNDQGVLIVEVGNSWEHVETAFPQVPFMWLSFESGGHGVFVITRQELLDHAAAFV